MVKQVTTGLGKANIPIGTPKMAENRHGSKQARFGVQAWTKSNTIRMHRSAEQTSRSSCGIRIPRTTSRRPQLSLRGVRAGGGIPRGIPRRLSLPRPLLCLREARVVFRRPRAIRGLTAFATDAVSSRGSRGIRNPAEDSAKTEAGASHAFLRGSCRGNSASHASAAETQTGLGLVRSPGQVRVGSNC